jgi:predicted Rossmann fold nucleotide-binding protein DprA/Smf involved in DNA uptake
MKIAVIGSRNFNDYELLKTVLKNYSPTCIISGGAKGADSLAVQYAHENKIELTIFKPEWGKYGKGAGLKRNQLIINNCDMVIAFWDNISKGTKNSIDIARQINKPLLIVNF